MVVEIHGVAVKITQTKNVHRIPIRWPNFDPRASFRLFFSNPHKNTAKEIKLPITLTNVRTLTMPKYWMDGKKQHHTHPIPGPIRHQRAVGGSGLVVIDHLPGVDGSLSLGREPRQPRQTWDGCSGAQPRDGCGASEAGDGTSHLGEREPEAKWVCLKMVSTPTPNG